MGIMPFLIIYMHLTLVGIDAYEASFIFPPGLQIKQGFFPFGVSDMKERRT